MAKLYFKYGAMGSSKTAQALITKYNYEENDMKVWLLKPSADTRDGVATLRSRIGLEAKVDVMSPQTDVYERFRETWAGKCHAVIVDECQFMTPRQIQQLRAEHVQHQCQHQHQQKNKGVYHAQKPGFYIASALPDLINAVQTRHNAVNTPAC